MAHSKIYTATGTAQQTLPFDTDRIKIATITPIAIAIGPPNIDPKQFSCLVDGQVITVSQKLLGGYPSVGDIINPVDGVVATGTTIQQITQDHNKFVLSKPLLAPPAPGLSITLNVVQIPSPAIPVINNTTTITEIIPGNTIINGLIVGKGNIIGYITIGSDTPQPFCISEIGN